MEEELGNQTHLGSLKPGEESVSKRKMWLTMLNSSENQEDKDRKLIIVCSKIKVAADLDKSPSPGWGWKKPNICG